MYRLKGERAEIHYDKNLRLWKLSLTGLTIYLEAPGWEVDKNFLKNRLFQLTCFEYIPREGDTIFDLGAGLGEETLILSNFVGEQGKIHAFEAHPRIATALSSSILLNKINNIQVIQKAVSSYIGEISIQDQLESYLGNTISDCDNQSLIIKTITLDSYIEKNNINKINLLKINIEGAERDALKGLNQYIQIVENVAISCHDFRANKGEGEFYRTKKFVKEYLSSYNFKITNQSTGIDYIDDWVYGHR